MMDPATLHSNLGRFTCTDAYHRCGLRGLVVCTDGVHYLRTNGDCLWLTDAIASYFLPFDKMKTKYGKEFTSMSLWTLRKDGEGGAVLEARADIDAPVRIRQEIPYTDFPFPDGGEFELYVAVGECGGQPVYVIMLPGEY